VLIVAIVYAGLWMVWAVRTHAANRFASITYGITSALILSPLLWESTVRFQILSPVFTAVVLVLFVVLALALAWRRDLQVIPAVATLATVTTALALIFATHELVPLTAALLAVALATETAACLGHRLRLRAVPAIAADLAVWLLVDVMTSSHGSLEGYHPASATTLTALCLALLAIYGGSIAIRSFWLRQPITIFEIGQGVLAFLLATYGAVRATQGSIAPALAVFFLLLAAVCYWGALSPRDRIPAIVASPRPGQRHFCSRAACCFFRRASRWFSCVWLPWWRLSCTHAPPRLLSGCMSPCSWWERPLSPLCRNMR
jgi:hypothetical protein